MTNVLMPFLMSMLLGRTIDLTTYTTGGSIYDDALYDETALGKSKSTYVVLQENAHPYTYMGLPVDIVLRIKSNILSSSSGAMGLDGLLKETTWKQRSVVVAVATNVQTIQRTLKKDAQLLSNWTSRIPDTQTHYSNSIIYGGWSIILYGFKCDIPGDVEIVRNTLTSALGVYGELGPLIIEQWKRAIDAINNNPEIRGNVTVHTHTYATFPFEYDIKSPTSLLTTLSKVPGLVGPVGKPLFMELLPLHGLDERFPEVKENHVLDAELEQIDQMYDDVKNTKGSVTHWVEETSTVFTAEQEKEIASLLSHLGACIKLFHKVASEASIFKDMDTKLLESSVLLYSQRLQPNALTYDRIFRRMKEDIDVECENDFLHRIKGILKVDGSERIDVGRVEGGLEECKSACLAVSNCRSIGYTEKQLTTKVDTSSARPFNKLISETQLCIVYFRSSSTADIVSPKAASVTGIYDRKCH